MLHARFIGLALAASSFVFASAASAGYTTINAPFPGESGIPQILGIHCGGTFVANGLNFGNGTIIAERIADSGGAESLNVVNGTAGADDRVWNQTSTPDHLNFIILGAYSASTQRLGYFDGTSGGTFHKLLDVTGRNGAATGYQCEEGLVDTNFRWARQSTTGAATITSLPSDNPDGKDHIVTYKLTGTGTGDDATWLLAFEDNTGVRSDFDFNDMAVLLRVTDHCAVPVPAAAWMGLVGLGGVAGLKRFRRKLA